MPQIDENRRVWDGAYDWTARGDEWSESWGGAAAQWHGSLLPRLRTFLPTPVVLEIAPGYGRWSQFLATVCEKLILVDLSEECIDGCRRRFTGMKHLEFHLNDGTSLQMVQDTSIDLVFSFDSLVHVEDDIISAYLSQLPRVLKQNGIAFLHHSNLAEHVDELTSTQELHDPAITHWRASSMSAQRFRDLATSAGLSCVGQEIINWGPHLIDCISLVTLPGSRWDRGCVTSMNPDFMAEARSIKVAAQIYTGWVP